MKRIGVVGIVLKGDRETVMEMQSVLSDFAEGSPERVSALTGRLGKFPSLSVKSAMTAFEVAE